MDRRRILLVVAVLVAALGAGLVFVYAQGADNRAQTDAVASTRILVATQPIDVGELATDAYKNGKIAFKDVPADTVITGATADPTLFENKVALTTIYPGEQLLTAKFGNGSDIATQSVVPVPDGEQLITITLGDVNHVGPFLQPGSHVALWYVPVTTATTDSTGGTTTVPFTPARVLIPDVLVLSIGSATTTPNAVDAQGNPLAVSPTTTIGLAVDPEETSLIGGASFTSSGAQTLFMTLVQGKNVLKTDPAFSGVLKAK